MTTAARVPDPLSETRPTPAGTLPAIAAGAFLLQLGLAPISAALPAIVADFDGDLQTGGWVMTAFLIVLTGLVLIAGRLGDHFGYQRVFRLGVVLFGVSSLAAALSVDLLYLIVARVGQGIGGALLSGNGLAVLTNAYGPARRGRAIGTMGVMSSLGGVTGLLFSTFFVSVLSWRWIFAMGVVLSVVTLALAWRLRDEPRRGTARLDIGGALALFGVLVFLSLSLSHLHEGEETFAAGTGYHATMHVLTLLSLAALIWWESRVADPILPYHHFRNRLFTSAATANGILHMTMMAVVFLLPFVVTRGLGLPPIYTGAMLLAMQTCTTASAYAGGWLFDRTRSRLITPVSMGVVGVGLTALGLFADRLDFWGLAGIVIFVGCFTGAFMTVNNTIVMSSLGPGQSGFASGIAETTRQLGHTLGITTVAAVVALGGGSLDAAAPPVLYLAGFQSASLTMGIIAFIGALLSLRSEPSRPDAPPAPRTAPAPV